MGDPDPVQLLVLQQRLHGRVVDGLDLPAPGRPDLDPGLSERLDDVGGQIGPDRGAEGGGHLVGQFGEAAGLATARVPLAEQFVQHRAVHVARSTAAPPAFISAATSIPADSAAVSSRIRSGCAVASCRRCCSAYTGSRSASGEQCGGLRLEQRGLRAGFGGRAAAVRRYGAAAQPGQGGRPPSGAPRPPLVARAEGSRRPRFVAPLHSHPRGEQRADTPRRWTPHPARDLRPLPHGRGEVGLPAAPAGGQPARTEGGDLHATVLGRSERPRESAMLRVWQEV